MRVRVCVRECRRLPEQDCTAAQALKSCAGRAKKTHLLKTFHPVSDSKGDLATVVCPFCCQALGQIFSFVLFEVGGAMRATGKLCSQTQLQQGEEQNHLFTKKLVWTRQKEAQKDQKSRSSK